MQVLAAVVLVFVLTGAWIIFDGLTDRGDKSDVALVVNRSELRADAPNAVLDHVVRLYKAGRFPYVIVVGAPWHATDNEDADAMAKYLEARSVPSNVIFVDDHGGTTEEIARHVADIMKTHEFLTVLIVSDYYQITRTKLSLGHEGIVGIDKSHIGTFSNADLPAIVREVVALYQYVGNAYVMPAAKQAQEDAKVGIDKASQEAQSAKDKVNKGLDKLPQ